MANPKHVEIVKQGAKAIAQWRDENPGATFDLAAANLRSADLVNANLSGADLSAAALSRANLRAADLRGADLSQAILFDTIFGHGVLSQTEFSRCFLSNTVFINIDLSSARGLECSNHHGPSSIGLDTIYRSRGKIPVVFLRGCGVPDALIATIPALMGALEPIQFYSCFISYSHKDEAFCQRLYSRLRDEKLRVWFAPEDMKGGRTLLEQVQAAIPVHDKVLLVLSDGSMRSDWVETEIRIARERERKSKRKVLFPISIVPFDRVKAWSLFDAGSGKDLAIEIRANYIPDFSHWKDHESFEAAFKRLLKDLRAEGERDKSDRGLTGTNPGLD